MGSNFIGFNSDSVQSCIRLNKKIFVSGDITFLAILKRISMFQEHSDID